MPVICQAFVENAWKKDLCANCFKSLEDHRKEGRDPVCDAQSAVDPGHSPVSGQDSLTELEQGTNRYQSVLNNLSPLLVTSRYSRQISKWNDTSFHASPDATGVTLPRLGPVADISSVSNTGCPAEDKHHETLQSDHSSITTSRATSSPASSLSPRQSLVSVSVLAQEPNPEQHQSERSGSERNNNRGLSGDDKFQTEESVNTVMKDSQGSHNVIQRLDSLVLGTPLNSLETEASGASSVTSSSSGRTGILKEPGHRDRSSPDKKRGITFPDYEELQEIIGYGGDMYYSSDDDEPRARPDRKSADTDYSQSEELTQEERSVLNITKKNTSFNSHPQNLKDPSSSPMPKLGVDKKHTPIISVRPFVREHTPGKVNMVSPMINGEVVTSRNNKAETGGATESKMFGSVSKRFEKEDTGGRGEIRVNKKDSLGSDGGSTETSSSDSDSNTRDSPSPTDPVIFSEFQINKEKLEAGGETLGGHKKQQSFLSSQIEEQKAKSSAASARLSFLSSYSGTKSDNVSVSPFKVKSSNYPDELPSPSILSSNNAKLSLLNKNNSSPSAVKEETDIKTNKKDDAVMVGQINRKVISSPASARLSFLSSTIKGLNKSQDKLDSQSSFSSASLTKLEPEKSVVVSGVSVIAPVTHSQISEHNGQSQEKTENSPDKSQSAPKNPPEKVATANRSESCKDLSPKVKLTRKSPYVVGPLASNSILKGTPKPMITRKPPILKDKPKVPLKPNKLMMRSPSSSPSPSPLPGDGAEGVGGPDAPDSQSGVETPAENNDPGLSPVAAPRKASFRQKSESVNIKTAGGAGAKLEETSSITVTGPGEKDSETSAGGRDRNNSLIISVSSTKTGPNDPPSVNTDSDSCKTETARPGGPPGNQSNKSENSPPQVQKNLVNKNKEALEAIRKSLSNKLISTGPPQLVMESIKASGRGLEDKMFLNKTPAEKTTSNSFEDARASIADALQFTRPDPAAAKTATKRQAPNPPDAESADELDQTFDNCQNESNDDPSTEITTEEVSNDQSEVNSAATSEPKLTPAIRNSSMKSEHSVKNKEVRTVQFSPETVTVTVPSSNSREIPKVISYNSWVGKYHHNHHLQSSFTGQPITMYPPGVVGPQMKKQGLGYAHTPVVDEGPRKWTEKKGKWRSKSTPRSSEIDEIMGSSKTKAQNRLTIFTPSSPQPIKRQSRVEIYESEKSRAVQQKQKGSAKFSLKKLFKIQPDGDSAEDGDNKLTIDKEHEREIVERKAAKARPEIIHPLDLMNSGVEVVKITPKNSVKGHYDKQKSRSSLSLAENFNVKKQADLKASARTDSDSKDSGHDTASIHTETSEGTGSSSGGDFSHPSVDFSPGLTPVGVVQQPQPPTVSVLSPRSGDSTTITTQSCLGVNSVGKPKPVPPPRSQSLETFTAKKGFKDDDESEEDEEDDNEAVNVDEKDNTVDETFSPGAQSTPKHPTSGLLALVTSDQTGYANQKRSGLAPSKPGRSTGLGETEAKTPGKSPSGNNHSPGHRVSGAFHVKTSSITGSLTGSEAAMSDSTISFPSSGVSGVSSGRGKAMDGSEADSERDSVSPQRIQDPETLYTETESESPSSVARRRVSRLSMRRGRSVVHKNLEDNYGAVISANHEALAQILEQVCQNRPTPNALKSLASCLNLRFLDFSVLSESEGLRTNKRAFFPATWGSSHLPVTLMVSRDMALNNNNVKNSFSLTPIAQFVDQVPSYLLPGGPGDAAGGAGSGLANSQAVVWALSRSHVLQFGTFAKNLKSRRKSLRIDEFEKDMSFVLLQLINGLKFLQAQGIEETGWELDSFLLARADNDNYHRLIITEECHSQVQAGAGAKLSLCQTALAAMLQLFDLPDPVSLARSSGEAGGRPELPQIIPSVSMFSTMASILSQGGPGGVSLGQVKSMLEFMLWGPSDIIFDTRDSSREAETREEALQRWLDLERATVLHNLIRTQGLGNIQLSVYEEYHLLFLVRTCAKMLCEASLLFESEVSRM